MEESVVSVVCLCVHRNRTFVCTGTGLVYAQEQDFFSKYKENKLNI